MCLCFESQVTDITELRTELVFQKPHGPFLSAYFKPLVFARRQIVK